MPDPESFPNAGRELERVTVGTVGKPHGLDGTVVVHPETDNPDRFKSGVSIRVGSDRTLIVRNAKSTESVLLVTFAGVSDRAGAEKLRGLELTIDPSERRSLETDEFWPEDLIELEVRDPSGNPIGRVKAVDADSPQHRLTVATAHGEFVVPLVAGLVPEVNVPGGYLVVEPIDGLLNQ